MPIIAAPPLDGTIEGITMIENGGNTGFFFIPPDPHGAAGTAHVVSIVNVSIEWHTKPGVQQASMSLATFFAPLAPPSVITLFDPKVIYDQYFDRFVVLVLEQQDVGFGDPADTSRILLAVSDDGDPNGTWFYYAINSKLTIGGTPRWADYPGLASDFQAVYVTANMFSFTSSGGGYGGSRLWIVNKVPLYTGGAGVSTVHDPSTATGVPATTTQPTQMFGVTPAGVGTFLVRYSGFSDGVDEALSIIRVDNPLTVPVFTHQFVDAGNIDNTATFVPDAPQLGSGVLIATNDRRSLNAVWRNNNLYTCAEVVPPAGADAGTATAHWWRVDTSTLAALSLADQGDVGGEDIAISTYTYFPSVAVDECDNMSVGFSASASSIYAGAYYTGRFAGDPPGFVQSSGTLAAGLDFYVRTFGSGSNRWGDYTATVVDPNGVDIWVFNQYADTRGNPTGTEDGRWRTRWGHFLFCTPVPVTVANLTVERQSDGAALLHWEARNARQHAGFHVFRQAPGGDRVRLTTELLAASPEYEFRDPSAPASGADYWLQEQAQNGDATWFGPVTLAAGEGPRVFMLESRSNPFRPGSIIAYSLQGNRSVQLAVFDVRGHRVAMLANGRMSAGPHRTTWDGRDVHGRAVSSGLYFIRLDADQESRHEKIVLVR